MTKTNSIFFSIGVMIDDDKTSAASITCDSKIDHDELLTIVSVILKTLGNFSIAFLNGETDFALYSNSDESKTK